MPGEFEDPVPKSFEYQCGDHTITVRCCVLFAPHEGSHLDCEGIQFDDAPEDLTTTVGHRIQAVN